MDLKKYLDLIPHRQNMEERLVKVSEINNDSST